MTTQRSRRQQTCVVCDEPLTSNHHCNEERLRRIEAGRKPAETRQENDGWGYSEAARLDYGLSLLDFQE